MVMATLRRTGPTTCKVLSDLTGISIPGIVTRLQRLRDRGEITSHKDGRAPMIYQARDKDAVHRLAVAMHCLRSGAPSEDDQP